MNNLNTALADALSAISTPSPDTPFFIGQRLRRLLRRPVTGTVIRLIEVETDDGRENYYSIPGAVVRLDRPDEMRDDYGRPVKRWEALVDSEDLDNDFWELA